MFQKLQFFKKCTFYSGVPGEPGSNSKNGLSPCNFVSGRSYGRGRIIRPVNQNWLTNMVFQKLQFFKKCTFHSGVPGEPGSNSVCPRAILCLGVHMAGVHMAG